MRGEQQSRQRSEIKFMRIEFSVQKALVKNFTIWQLRPDFGIFGFVEGGKFPAKL
jgi:hypothetical protein